MPDSSYWLSLAADYISAYRQSFGKPGTKQAIVLAMAVAEHETNNGRAWPGTNNFGAVQLRGLTLQEMAAYQSGTLKSGDYSDSKDGVLHVDTHPTPSGPAKYPIWFAAFPTRVAGVAYFLKTLWRLSAGAPDDPNANASSVAKAMYLRGYYEGAHAGARPVWNKGQLARTDPLTSPEQANVNDYSGAVQRCLDMITPMLVGWDDQPTPPPDPGQEAGEADADEGLPHYNPQVVKTEPTNE